MQRQTVSDVFIVEAKLELPSPFFFSDAFIPNKLAESREKLFTFFICFGPFVLDGRIPDSNYVRRQDVERAVQLDALATPTCSGGQSPIRASNSSPA
jgi:hypothetical protein